MSGKLSSIVSEESVMKTRIYESLTTVCSLLIVSSFLYVWVSSY
ncbi:hypothetical protein BN4901_4927 [Citrobacter europaeus]|nr:hypothetical protein BN4901_4927 [Citrobacter europaeus]